MQSQDQSTMWLPDLLYTGSRFESGLALVTDVAGRISHITRAVEAEMVGQRVERLRDRALLPGLINAHSHAFQRVIRGRTEYRAHATDSFWTWREMMYAAAQQLTPEDLYDAAQMAFLEMIESGITSVGEFHYLHHTPAGAAYEDVNLLAKQVVRAARDVGLRIALLRVAYVRSGFETPPNPRQVRFIETNAELFLTRLDALRCELDNAARLHPQGAVAPRGAWTGCAPHSTRAVPLSYLRALADYAAEQLLPLHMHVSEQPAENAACLAEYGRTPIALLADEGLLSERLTVVHGIHLTPAEAQALARARALVCACPTTERNLGDGIVPVDVLFVAGVRVSLGTDSHTQIDLLEDARELEYHLRLHKLERAVLDSTQEADATRPATTEVAPNQLSRLAARLFDCATRHGAASLGSDSGALAIGRPADFFTVDLNDPSIAGAGADDLLPAVVFSLARTAVREVVVGGEPIVTAGHHPAREEITSRFAALQRRLWT